MKKILSIKPIVIIGALFFVFGFVTWLNAMLIPYLKIACELSNFQASLVAFAFYIAYFVFAVPSSFLLQKTGFKRGMSIGLGVMAIGAFLFIPAAYTRTYGLFLSGLFVMGGGLALLQTAANPYVAILGTPETAARRISIMGVCNKIAGAIAPLLLGMAVMDKSDEVTQALTIFDALGLQEQKEVILQQVAEKAVIPYICICGTLILLAIAVFATHLPDIEEKEGEDLDTLIHETQSIWHYPRFLFGVIALFLYVGVEVVAVDQIVNYGHFLGFSMTAAKAFPTYTLLAMIAGYFVGIALMPKWLSQRNALVYSACSGIIFSLAAIFAGRYLSISSIVLLGLSNALIWPAIWGLALQDLPSKLMKTGSSMLIMAIAGGALVPLLYGRLSDIINPQQAYWILVPCYLIILLYAIYGTKPAFVKK